MLTLVTWTDLHKVYIDDEHYNAGHGHAHETYGIDPAAGAVVIVRPDQCKYCVLFKVPMLMKTDVAQVASVSELGGIERLFNGFMIRKVGSGQKL